MPTRSRPRMSVRFLRSQSATANCPRVPLEAALAHVFVQMDPQLGIASRGQGMPTGKQLFLKLGIFEDFTVLRDPDRAVLVAERLPAPRQIDDREPACTQGQPRLEMNVLVIRPAVRNGAGHCQQPRQRGTRADLRDQLHQQYHT